VQSQPDVGSTFTVLLPTEAVAYTSPLTAIDVRGVPCVLLRDPDAPQEMDDMATHLQHAGAVVTIVATASEAHAALRDAAKPVVFVRRVPNGAPSGVDGFSDDDVRGLHITDGRRRTARVVAPSLVTLDRYYLRSRSLLRAVAIAAGRASPELLNEDLPALNAPAPRAAPISVEQARAEGQLILVAEDDEVNQKVIMQQLALLGFAAEIARNGAEALDMLKQNRYALLLTDLHMPVMDGYELTRRIRSDEAETSAPYPLPIVALTANALRGEETRARDLGMTAFLTKPVLLNVLKGTLSQWVTPQVAAPTPRQAMPAVAPAGTSLPTLDIAVLQSLVGDDADIIHEFLTDYRTSAQRIASDIRLAHTQGDLTALGAACHKLKSSSRSVGALSLGELCQKIEQSARQRDVESVNRSTEEFEPEFAAVMNALSSALS
jgi:CheY-like chemotaxis protein